MNDIPTTDFSIWYGTESGNAEMAAEDLAAEFGVSAEQVRELRELPLDEIDIARLTVIVCSTHGEGELPTGAQIFAERLIPVSADAPLAGLRYLLMGLGDRSYAETYSRGAEVLDELLQSAGARRIGEIGRHDASSWDDVSETTLAWAREALAWADAEPTRIESIGATA